MIVKDHCSTVPNARGLKIRIKINNLKTFLFIAVA